MANFTWEIKRDFLQNFPRDEDCVEAALSALLATAGSATPRGEIGFTSENERVAEYFLRLSERLALRAELWNAERDPKSKKDKLTFLCKSGEAERLMRSDSYRYAESEERALAYLRAAFLGSGSCTLPQNGAKTGFHLEFAFTSLESAEGFCEILAVFELLGKLVKRGERYVVYLKSREAISDFLSVSGAHSAFKRFEEVSALREESNNSNRVSNCFAGNADKTAIASAAQTVAFSELERTGKLETLPEELRAAARARIGNPTLALSELAAMLGITKSCLNHRLRKLMQLAAK